MALDRIPNLDWNVIETHYYDRHRSPEESLRFKAQVEEYMNREENKPIRAVIQALALKSRDKNSVYEAVYTLLDMINAQIEVDELNALAEIRAG